MAEFTADIYANTTAAKARLAGMAGRATDLRPATRVVRELIMAGHKENWESQGASFGTPWAANAPGTIARKGSSKPMEATGALRAAIYGGKGRSTSASKTLARVGVRLSYARFALGTGGYRPKRPMVGISRTTEGAALKVLERYLVNL